MTCLPPALLLAACSNMSGSKSKSGTIAPAAKSSTPSTPTPDATVVTGRLVVATDTNPATPAGGADVYLEGTSDAKYPTAPQNAAQAGVFHIEVPDAGFKSGAGLTDSELKDESKIAWYAVYEIDGKKYGVEQPNVIVRRNETTDLNDVLLTPTGSIKGNVSKVGFSQQAGTVVQIPGTIFKTTTNSYGDFVLDGIPAASWNVEVVAAGFAKLTIAAVKVIGGGAVEVPRQSLTTAP